MSSNNDTGFLGSAVKFAAIGGERTLVLRRDSDFIVLVRDRGMRVGRFVSTSPSRFAMNSASSAVATGYRYC